MTLEYGDAKRIDRVSAWTQRESNERPPVRRGDIVEGRERIALTDLNLETLSIFDERCTRRQSELESVG